MIRGMIFDVDGVILDSMPVWDDAGRRYLKSLKLAARADLDKTLSNMSIPEAAAYLKKAYRLIQSEDVIVKEIEGVVSEFYINEAPLKPGTKEFIIELHKNHIPMVIATSSNRSYLEEAFKRLEISRFFQAICTCTELRTSKNNSPLIYEKAAEIILSRPLKSYEYRDFWVVEDSLHAIKTAKAAGFSVLAVYDESAKSEHELIESIADHYLMKLGTEISFIFEESGMRRR